MHNPGWRTTVALIAVLICAEPIKAETLKVGVTGSPPFVIREGEKRSGISLDVWLHIAEENDLAFDLISQSSPKEGIQALNDGSIDLLIGPISITPRRLAMPKVDFTQPYYMGRVGVLLPLEPPSLLSRVQVFFGWAVVSSILVMISVLLVVGSLIWLAERRRNPEQFPRRWMPGIASGMWFAVVTLTTVGYGDKAPVTRTGRGITGAWMIISLIAVSSLTASLASAFTLFLSGSTLDVITNPLQLKERRVAVVSGTSGMDMAEQGEMRLVPSADLKGAVQLLLEGQADALVFDEPAIRYHLKQNPQLPLQVAPFNLGEETYGFALKANDPLRTPLNVSILRMQKMGEIEAIDKKNLN